MRATIGYIFASMVESVKFLFDLIKLQCHHRQCTFDEQNFVCVRPDICGERKSDTMCVACKKIYILPFSNKWQEKQPKKNTQKEKEKRKTLPSTGRKKNFYVCSFHFCSQKYWHYELVFVQNSKNDNCFVFSDKLNAFCSLFNHCNDGNYTEFRYIQWFC